MKIYYLEFPFNPEIDSVLILGSDDGKISLEQAITAIDVEFQSYGTMFKLEQGDLESGNGYGFVWTDDNAMQYESKVEVSEFVPCYGLPEDEDAVKHLLPKMIPQRIQNEVLIRWNARAMSQGYPIPQKDGTFGKPTKSNLEAAERELCFFFGAVACYDALTDALKTKETSAPPVWVFPVMQGHSIAWSMEHNL